MTSSLCHWYRPRCSCPAGHHPLLTVLLAPCGFAVHNRPLTSHQLPHVTAHGSPLSHQNRLWTLCCKMGSAADHSDSSTSHKCLIRLGSEGLGPESALEAFCCFPPQDIPECFCCGWEHCPPSGLRLFKRALSRGALVALWRLLQHAGAVRWTEPVTSVKRVGVDNSEKDNRTSQ